ncbi:flagellar motor switch protein FliN [Pseudomethylobacillus aquaticus]|uniref:Flagellar motor switch protein FliN n=1 Tax=Pseudomethylobacillus aquaticus TaxID=2676064 RepID=A0A3N0UZF4_9PROT|nr:FliM/FliN family flagellar motor switch protein [Pseudomethylobacillus aquaticus]ROH85910.1 flagellar motor switch protein FliN [Pseudomethylobacillus aquaticus]
MKQNESSIPVKPETRVAKEVALSELTPVNTNGTKLLNGNFSIISGLKVSVEVLVGSAEISVEELFSLDKGSVVALQESHHAPLIVRLDGKPIASGNLVVVGDRFGIAIQDILATPAAK